LLDFSVILIVTLALVLFCIKYVNSVEVSFVLGYSCVLLQMLSVKSVRRIIN